jgi:hypothetical protein
MIRESEGIPNRWNGIPGMGRGGNFTTESTGINV